jgi:hypothetical protein
MKGDSVAVVVLISRLTTVPVSQWCCLRVFVETETIGRGWMGHLLGCSSVCGTREEYLCVSACDACCRWSTVFGKGHWVQLKKHLPKRSFRATLGACMAEGLCVGGRRGHWRVR